MLGPRVALGNTDRMTGGPASIGASVEAGMVVEEIGTVVVATTEGAVALGEVVEVPSVGGLVVVTSGARDSTSEDGG